MKTNVTFKFLMNEFIKLFLRIKLNNAIAYNNRTR